MITLPNVATISGARHRAEVGLARVVARGGRELARLERGPARQLFLRTIMLVLPLKFDPKKARDLDVVLEIRLLRPDGDEYDPVTITIQKQKMSCPARACTRPGHDGEPHDSRSRPEGDWRNRSTVAVDRRPHQDHRRPVSVRLSPVHVALPDEAPGVTMNRFPDLRSYLDALRDAQASSSRSAVRSTGTLRWARLPAAARKKETPHRCSQT